MNKLKFFYGDFFVSFVFGVALSLTGFFKPEAPGRFNILSLLAGFLLSMFLIHLFRILASSKIASHMDELSISSKAIFFTNFFAVALLGLIYQIIYYPALCNNDTIFIIRGGLGTSSQHPWEYIIILRAIRKIAKALGGSDSTALLFLALIQNIGIAFAYSHCLVWLKEKRVSKIPLLIADVFLLVCPILNLYKITLIKDVPFAIGFMLLVPLMYDIWESEGKILASNKTILYLMVCTYLLLCRNNGIYICIILAIVCMCMYRKMWIRMAVYLLCLVVIIISTKYIQQHANAKYLFREAVGVPIQQIAATVHYDGELTAEQKEFVNEILPIEVIKEKYDPYNADALKYGEVPMNDAFLNENRGKFIKTYFEILRSNLDLYVDAYLRSTYGFWSFTNSTYKMRYTYIGAFSKEDAFEEWFEEERIIPKSILPKSLQTVMEGFTSSTAVFLGVGSTVWLLVCILSAFCFTKKKSVVVALPVIMCWITILLASPIAFQWRYGFCFAVVLPIYFGMLFIPDSVKEKV